MHALLALVAGGRYDDHAVRDRPVDGGLLDGFELVAAEAHVDDHRPVARDGKVGRVVDAGRHALARAEVHGLGRGGPRVVAVRQRRELVVGEDLDRDDRRLGGDAADLQQRQGDAFRQVEVGTVVEAGDDARDVRPVGRRAGADEVRPPNPADLDPEPARVGLRLERERLDEAGAELLGDHRVREVVLPVRREAAVEDRNVDAGAGLADVLEVDLVGVPDAVSVDRRRRPRERVAGRSRDRRGQQADEREAERDAGTIHEPSSSVDSAHIHDRARRVLRPRLSAATAAARSSVRERPAIAAPERRRRAPGGS